jgi:hypothetical protein
MCGRREERIIPRKELREELRRDLDELLVVERPVPVLVHLGPQLLHCGRLERRLDFSLLSSVAPKSLKDYHI